MADSKIRPHSSRGSANAEALLFQNAGHSFGRGFVQAASDADLMAKITAAVGGLFNGTTGLDFNRLIKKLTDQVTASIEKGITNIDLSGSADALGEELRNSVNRAGGGFADGIGDVMSRLSKNITVAVLPYAISALALTVGTPLAVHYLYKKMMHNLGKPKLAAEVYKVNELERFGIVVQNGLKRVVQIFGSGLKWGALTGGIGIASMLPVFLLGEYNSLGGNRPRYLDHPEHYMQTIGEVSALVAGGTTSYQLIKESLSSLRKFMNAQPDPNPIFNDTITSSIDEIVHSTRNIRENGGFFQNVLLYGPGGTGKTMVAKMIAKQSGMNYISLSGGALPECIKRGEHITELRKLFSSIKEPTVVFIDEIESLAKSRDQMQRSEELELINELLNLTGTDSNLILLVAATNRPQTVDRDMLTRFNRKLFIAPPGLPERIRILDEHLPYFFTRVERSTVLNPLVVNQMAEYTEGLTGRALFKMANSLYAKKMMAKDQVLRPEMIASTMEQFIAQEREIEKWQTESFYTKMPESRGSKPLSPSKKRS